MEALVWTLNLLAATTFVIVLVALVTSMLNRDVPMRVPVVGGALAALGTLFAIGWLARFTVPLLIIGGLFWLAALIVLRRWRPTSRR